MSLEPYDFVLYSVWEYRPDGLPAGYVNARSAAEAVELARPTFPCPIVKVANHSDFRLPRCLDPL